MSWCRLFAKGLLWEFHYSKFWTAHTSWKSFVFTPWLPDSFVFQLAYLIYRWILCLFFFISVFFTGFDEFSGDEKYFIYLTNWIFLLWTAYTIFAAFSVTCSFIFHFGFNRPPKEQNNTEGGGPCNHELVIDDRPVGCCGKSNDKTFWHQKVLWIFYATAVPMQVFVVVLYWSLVYSPDTIYPVTGFVNIVTHAFNGFMAIVDVFVTGMPYRLLHAIYPFLFGASWFVFSGIYYGAGGTNVSGERYIYPAIDYMNHPVVASFSGLAILFIGVPVFHLFIYCITLLRELILFLIAKYCPCQKRAGEANNISANEVSETTELKVSN